MRRDISETTGAANEDWFLSSSPCPDRPWDSRETEHSPLRGA